MKQGWKAQHDSHWSGPSPLFSLQPAWSRCCRQAGCSRWLWGIPLCSLLPRLHQWHRYGLALKTEVMLYNRLLVLLDGHALVHSFSAQPQDPASVWQQPTLSCPPALALWGPQWCSPGELWPSQWQQVTDLHWSSALGKLLCLEPGPRGSHTLSCSPETRPVGTQLFLKGLPWGILPGQLPVASLRCQAYRQRSWCRGSLIQAMKLLGWCNEGVNWSLFLASMNLPLPKGSYRQKAQLDIFQSDL